MTPEQIPSDTVAEYQKLLDLLGLTEKYFEDLKIDCSCLKSYKQLLRFLRSLPEESIREVLGGTNATSEKAERRLRPELAEIEVRSMPSDKILELASNQETPRRLLEQIASVRFGVTKGALSALRSRRALAEKITTSVNNEEAHESITRAAAHANRKS
jgi:hypothetical protein